MNYSETLNFLFTQLPVYQRDGQAAYKANLDNTIALDKYFDHPHQKYKTIHVAGTNGKGSVSHMLASILQEAGLKVGLYTSPHLIDFRERMKVNGDLIPEKDVIDFVEKHHAIIKDLKPSFFEMTVAMAFNYFAQENVDVAVIEVGMGGRLDSTNIITPLVSIITNIGLDHTQFLGSSIKEIAKEKAGIIKEGIPVIIGEFTEETYPVFKAKAKEKSAFICFSQNRFKVRSVRLEKGFRDYTVRNEQSGTTFNISLDLLGNYQQRNLPAVFGALQILVPFFNIPKESITNGLSKVSTNTGLKGRWLIISETPKVICDTGHNKEGVELIVKQLEKETYTKLYFVFGTVNDKDAFQILKLLPPNAYYFFTQANIPRAMNADKLLEIGMQTGLKGEACSNVEEAYSKALKQAKNDDLVFVGGSTFIVADLLKVI